MNDLATERRPRFWVWQVVSLVLLVLVLLALAAVLVLALLNPWAIVLLGLFPTGVDRMTFGHFPDNSNAMLLMLAILGPSAVVATLVAPLVYARRGARRWAAGAHEEGCALQRKAGRAMLAGAAVLVAYAVISTVGAGYRDSPGQPTHSYGSGMPGTGAAAR